MYTLSWHQEGEKHVNQAHNRREPHAIGKSSDIDKSLSGHNITLVDIPIRDAYHRLFDKSVAEYNSRARASRQIDDYYTHIGKSSVGKGKSGKQRAYEAIVQIGSKAEGSPKQAVKAFKQYVAGWQQRNPNMVLIGAYIHLDEPQGTPHMHIDYISAARCNRGMKLQNSLTRALAEQGFKNMKHGDNLLTAQQQWEQSERDCMREICRELGIDLYKQGIGRKRHLSVKEYKDCQEQIKHAKNRLSALEGEQLIAEFDQQILLQDNKQLESKKQESNKQLVDLQKQVSVLSEKRQFQRDGLAHDQEAWVKFRADSFNRIEWLEAFQSCVEQYEPNFYQCVSDFLEYQGLDPNYWPDNLYADEEIEQYIDDDNLEL